MPHPHPKSSTLIFDLSFILPKFFIKKETTSSEGYSFLFLNELFEYTIEVYDPDDNDFIFEIIDAPEGMLLENGIISWVPNTTGLFGPISILVTDLNEDNPLSGSQVFYVDVRLAQDFVLHSGNNLISYLGVLEDNSIENMLLPLSNNVTDIIEQDELVENMDIFVKSIKEFNENTEEITSGLDSYQGNLNGINMCVLLDLSMKNKQLYLDAFELNEDKTIPENIHNIFLNYIYILNLIKKQIIYYKKSIKKVQEIALNMKKHTVNTKMSVKSHDKLFMRY